MSMNNNKELLLRLSELVARTAQDDCTGLDAFVARVLYQLSEADTVREAVGLLEYEITSLRRD